MADAHINYLDPEDSYVVTHHAEILLYTEYGMMSVWNITPINNTYKYQLEAIAARFNNELVKIQIIIGSNAYFYDQLQKYLSKLEYQIYKSTDQHIGILFNLNYFTLSQSISYEYQNENGLLTMPVVYLKTLDRKFLILAAVNMTDTYTGLRYIQSMLKQIQNSLVEYNVSHYILAGSFNTNLEEVQKAFPDLHVKIPEYYTVLTEDKACYNDMILVSDEHSTEILSSIYTSPCTQALIEHIKYS